MCPSRCVTYWAIYIINLFTQSTNPRVCFLQFIKDSSHSLSSLLLKRKRQFLIPPLPEKHEMGMHRNQMSVYLLNKKYKLVQCQKFCIPATEVLEYMSIWMHLLKIALHCLARKPFPFFYSMSQILSFIPSLI